MSAFIYLPQVDIIAHFSSRASFYFESSFSSFRSLLALVVHLAPQQDSVGRKFLCSDPLKIGRFMIPRILFFSLYFKQLAILNYIKQQYWNQCPYIFSADPVPSFCVRSAINVHCWQKQLCCFNKLKGIGRERFILEPGGGAVNQNHFTHAYKWRRLCCK